MSIDSVVLINIGAYGVLSEMLCNLKNKARIAVLDLKSVQNVGQLCMIVQLLQYLTINDMNKPPSNCTSTTAPTTETIFPLGVLAPTAKERAAVVFKSSKS